MKTAFITGLGRSGTKFLTALLSECAGTDCRHEFTGNREFWILSWYQQPDIYTLPYLEREKKRIESSAKAQLFIDVNGYLHHCTPQLKATFSPVAIFHLVRDPKYVIRSLYSRRIEKDIHIVPKSKPEVERWLDEDKFYRICWNWKEATEKSLNEGWPVIRFESILNDYSYLTENILNPLGISLSQSQWEQKISLKINRTRPAYYRKLYSIIKGKPYIEEKIPPYNEWTARQKEIFKELCQELMIRCGYPQA